jgi:hypothetical protein
MGGVSTESERRKVAYAGPGMHLFLLLLYTRFTLASDSAERLAAKLDQFELLVAVSLTQVTHEFGLDFGWSSKYWRSKGRYELGGRPRFSIDLGLFRLGAGGYNKRDFEGKAQTCCYLARVKES